MPTPQHDVSARWIQEIVQGRAVKHRSQATIDEKSGFDLAFIMWMMYSICCTIGIVINGVPLTWFYPSPSTLPQPPTLDDHVDS
ncbi:hypothetical protein N7447_000718 [Penicillium robsamsonii]|uniref:uncharacterized protein n=1 Tax=Penicillium robsamsonii TaxID=1792511 RepID=UPI0025495C11|nr:uncharacterized protein N7447_000718 [Penicillium robsamsonii]KAJ5834692.1 hypothetical protein N7447_000718 [Penicillium robsamsonii]